jgi:hypothetical protein
MRDFNNDSFDLMSYYLMTKKRSIVSSYWILITIIIAYPLMSLMSEGSIRHFHAYGQTADSINDDLLTIDGIECAEAEQFAFHIHTQFNITINNQSYPIPAGIGIVPNNCIYWMHTHDDSGLIHIESPIKKEFTLGQFLDIWNRFNSSDTVVQNITNDNVNGTLLVYINGTQMNNNTDYRDIELKDRGNISLIISDA